MQTIEPSFLDPLKNMTAAVNYVRSEYAGAWTGELEIRPRQGGKATAIARAEAIAETVAMRPEMAEIMERAMAHGYDGGGVLPSPTGRLPRLHPGEHVMTPAMAGEIARDMVGRWTAEERMAWDDGIHAAFDELNEPPDDYPEPPALPCW